MDLRLKTIATFLTPEDAEVARLALEVEGISTSMEGATTVGMVWYYGNAAGWVKLQVAETDEARAREIFARKVEIADAGGSDRVCPKCGVELPAGFEVCWSCQAPVDAEQEAGPSTHAAVPTRMDAGDEEVAEETDAGDELAWRALRAAVFGIFFCPPLLTFYSGWLFLRLALGDQKLSPKGNRNFYVAIFIDLAVCSAVGWFPGIPGLLT
jgi:hypothetical protein